MTQIEPLADVMNYYYFVTTILYCFMVAVVLAAIAGIRNRKFLGYSIGITVLGGIAMGSHLMFLGVLADNMAELSAGFVMQNVVMAVICLVLFVWQVVKLFRGMKDS